jgi:hypothetical protein
VYLGIILIQQVALISLSEMKIQRTWTEHLLEHGHSYASLIACKTTWVPRIPLPYFYSTNSCTAARTCLCAAFGHKIYSGLHISIHRQHRTKIISKNSVALIPFLLPHACLVIRYDISSKELESGLKEFKLVLYKYEVPNYSACADCASSSA